MDLVGFTGVEAVINSRGSPISITLCCESVLQFCDQVLQLAGFSIVEVWHCTAVHIAVESVELENQTFDLPCLRD